MLSSTREKKNKIIDVLSKEPCPLRQGGASTIGPLDLWCAMIKMTLVEWAPGCGCLRCSGEWECPTLRTSPERRTWFLSCAVVGSRLSRTHLGISRRRRQLDVPLVPSMLFCLVFCFFFSPPLQGLDEENHLQRAFVGDDFLWLESRPGVHFSPSSHPFFNVVPKWWKARKTIRLKVITRAITDSTITIKTSATGLPPSINGLWSIREGLSRGLSGGMSQSQIIRASPRNVTKRRACLAFLSVRKQGGAWVQGKCVTLTECN